MNSTVQNKEEFKIKTGIDVDKYVSQDLLDGLIKNIEKIFSVLFTLILPAIIANAIFIPLSVYIGFTFDSYVKAIIFFLVSLIISVIGCGILGIRNAVKKTSEGIINILNYTFKIFLKTYEIIENEGRQKSLSSLELFCVITVNIVLPIIKLVIKKKLFFIGVFLYFILEKIVLKALEPIINKLNASTKDTDASNEKVEKIEEDIKPFLEGGFKIVRTSSKIFTTILGIIGVGVVILGLAIEVILLVIY
ncbi:UNVERIFIED_CONTAM: hypothetical protein Cloal_1270 [Acetivibrio alkalicellulosi]